MDCTRLILEMDLQSHFALLHIGQISRFDLAVDLLDMHLIKDSAY